MFKLRNDLRAIVIALFCFIQLCFGVSIQLTSGTMEKWLCFISIMISALFALCFFRKSMVGLLMVIGLLLTLCADFFLVMLTPINRLTGMIFFLFVQLIYGARLYVQEKSILKRRALLIVRAILFIIGIILALIVLKKQVDALAILSVVYYINLIMNLILAFISKNLLLAIGLVLFACCDLFVGLQVMSDLYFTINENSILHSIIFPPFNVVWAFYVPSQTLIAVSTVRK